MADRTRIPTPDHLWNRPHPLDAPSFPNVPNHGPMTAERIELVRMDLRIAELVAALSSMVIAMDECQSQSCTCHRGGAYPEATALLARIKGCG